MLIELSVISAAVAPHIKKYALEKSAKLGKDYADSKLAQLYKRLVPDEKLSRAVESFVLRFDKELDSSADIPTLTIPAYQNALQLFLTDPDVLETLEKPLDAQSDLDWEFLSRRWTYLQGNDEKPLIPLPADFDWQKLAKRYCEAVRNQAIANSELRPVIEAQASLRAAKAAEETASAVRQMAGPAKSFDLAAYAESIKDLYRYIRLGSMDADWAVYENRVHLENIYVPQSAKQALPPRDLTRDYLRQLKAQIAHVNEEELIQQKELYATLNAVPIMQVVNEPENNRLVLLGDPGLGKSTLLKYLALQWAEKQSRPIVFLVELRRAIDQTENINFLSYIEQGRGQAKALSSVDVDKHLREHESYMLFDGLDEVLESTRSDAVSAIISFAREYPKMRVIVTTRIHGYYPGSAHPEEFRNAQFQQFTLQDFSPDEINKFITTWHKEAFSKGEERTRYQSRVQKALDDSPAIRELAANPLLLTMMTILNRVQDLPRDRGRLYERCAELLLKNWDLEKFPERMTRTDTRDIKDKLGPDQKMRILELVAAAMQLERSGLAGNIIAEDRLKTIVEQQLIELGITQSWAIAEDLIAMLRERNFMLAYLGNHQYAFVHRTFLEYFVARDLKYHLEKTSAFSIDQLAKIFKERWAQDEWQEVIRLLCGMVGSEFAGKCVSVLVNEGNSPGSESAIFLAAECLQEIRESGNIKELRESVKRALTNILTSNQAQSDKDPNKVLSISIITVQLLIRGWKDDLGMLECLKEQVTSPVDSTLAFIVVRVMTREYAKEQWILPWLTEQALKNKREFVRATALMNCGVLWANTASDTSYLQDLLLQVDQSKFSEISMPALKFVASHLAMESKKSPTLLKWLQGFIVQGIRQPLREMLIKSLLDRWEENKEMTNWLMKEAASISN